MRVPLTGTYGFWNSTRREWNPANTDYSVAFDIFLRRSEVFLPRWGCLPTLNTHSTNNTTLCFFASQPLCDNVVLLRAPYLPQVKRPPSNLESPFSFFVLVFYALGGCVSCIFIFVTTPGGVAQSAHVQWWSMSRSSFVVCCATRTYIRNKASGLWILRGYDTFDAQPRSIDKSRGRLLWTIITVRLSRRLDFENKN